MPVRNVVACMVAKENPCMTAMGVNFFALMARLFQNESSSFSTPWIFDPWFFISQ
jgi:hypothetical protein